MKSEKQSFPYTTQNWIAFGRLVATYNFAALPFFVAVEMGAQMGQIANTAWKNTCGTLAVQRQQWHPCEWQD